MRALRRVYQIAYVVDDIETAAHDWIKVANAGPFYVFRHFAFQNPVSRGKPIELDISIALGISGNTHVELIEVHKDSAKLFDVGRAVGAPGLHHVARLTDTIEEDQAKLEATGATCVFEASYESVIRFRFHDTRRYLGCYTEFVEFSPLVDGMLQTIEQAGASFDGTDPLRSF